MMKPGVRIETLTQRPYVNLTWSFLVVTMIKQMQLVRKICGFHKSKQNKYSEKGRYFSYQHQELLQWASPRKPCTINDVHFQLLLYSKNIEVFYRTGPSKALQYKLRALYWNVM